jgi:hypothetical protein
MCLLCEDTVWVCENHPDQHAPAAAPACRAQSAIRPAKTSRRGFRKGSSPTQSSGSRLKTTGRNAYIRTMPSKHIELPPRVAQAFVRDMCAFFKAKNQLKQDEIASRQLHALWAFQRPREKKLRLADVKELFHQMRADD